ncbi:nitrilase-related carbon-nitrogen hydrolase [uncultured Thioclava sp.]|uniref:nitrilase-related carbon-nitrogen hydrolase n=1 Tax=uncultured Thioclava sp. TaxID=473858 RepID=UPI0034591203
MNGVFARIEEVAHLAARAGAALAIFPELILPGYNQQDSLISRAQSLDGPWLIRLQTIARKSGVALVLGRP